MVQNLVCAQNELQVLLPISFCKSKDGVEALDDEFHDLGNMFNFQTFCLLSIIKCVLYSNEIQSIAIISFSFVVINQVVVGGSSSSKSSSSCKSISISVDD